MRCVRIFAIPPFVLPGPGLVLADAGRGRAAALASLLVTLTLTFEGFVLAAVGGIALAVLFNQSRLVEYSLYPYAVILQVTPIVAIAPLLLIYLPQPLAVLACAWIVAFFPVLANTTLGLSSVDHNLVALFDLCKASRWQTLWHLKLPAALPQMLAGLRIAGGLSLIGAVVAEIAAGSAGAGSGLAYRIAESGYRLNIPRMFAALLLLSLAGVAIFFALSALSHLACAAGTRARSAASARFECQLHDDAERRHRDHHFDQAAVKAERQHCGNHRQHRCTQVERERIEGVPAQRPGTHFRDLAEQHVQREPHRQVQDHADDGSGDRGQRAG